MASVSGYSVFAGTLAEMTYPELEAAVARQDVVLLPVGVLEQHGPHLPLGTDVYGASVLCRLVAERFGPGTVVMPPVYWGVNAVTGAFPGSFRTRPEVLGMLLDDVLDSLFEDGFRRVVLVNHHGDLAHNQVLLEVVQRHQERGRAGVRFAEHDRMIHRLGHTGTEPVWLRYEPDFDGVEHSGVLGVHADETETALVSRWFPELVRYDELDRLEPTDLGPEDLAEWRRGGEHARKVTPDGYFGQPRPVGPDSWRRYERMADALTEALRRWLSTPG